MLLYTTYVYSGRVNGTPPEDATGPDSPNGSTSSARAAQSDNSAVTTDQNEEAGDDGGPSTNFTVEGTPYYKKYTSTSRTWDDATQAVVVTTGLELVTAIAILNSDGETVRYEDGPVPPTYILPRATIVQELTVPANSPNPKLANLTGKLVRIHHDEPAHLGDITVEVVNVLVLGGESIVNIPAASPPGTGQATLYVTARDLVTSISPAKVEAQLLTRNGVNLNTPDWHEFTNNGTSATVAIDLTLPGTYTYVVRVSDNQPQLTGSFTITQVTAGATYALAIDQYVEPTPTALGQATGALKATLKGGPGIIDVVLMQGTTYIKTVSTAAQNSSLSTSSVTFNGLVAGNYTLTAHLRDSASTPEQSTTGDVPPPDLEIGDQLTFLPWVQSRLARAANAVGIRPSLSLGATLKTDGQPADLATTIRAEIYGPGDVLGINQASVLNTTPAPNASGFSPLQLAAIEFKEEDLPWRYSLPKTGTAAPLPWCFLLVLKEDEFETLPLKGQPLPSIRIHANGPYPSTVAEQQLLWAHVQVNTSLGDPGQPNAVPPIPPSPITATDVSHFLDNVLPTNPDLAYSRVFCPRRLEESTTYHAFLLPAIEAGRLGGLGLSYDASHTGTSIQDPTQPRDFPVYFQWQFATGVEEDFETLAGQLFRANEATSTAPAATLAVTLPTTMYALLMPSLLLDTDAAADADPSGTAARELAVGQYLYNQLAPGFTLRRPTTGRPVVTPPLYGRAYMVTPTLLEPRTELAASWKHTVNLDPRYRALAAIGAQVVQDNQEEYVRRAWEQVQDILLANEKLRGMQYGLRTTAGLRDQHLPLNTTTTTGAASGNRSAGLMARNLVATTNAGVNSAADTSSTSTSLADYGLHLTSLSLGRVRVSSATVAADATTNPNARSLTKLTVREAIRRSSTPLAAFSPTFRRIMKPFGKYQVGQAGRPLRPTQPEPDFDATTDLRQTGTSLRQRDVLLSRLAAGELTPAPERAQLVRAYQFLDQVVDDTLVADTKPREDGTLPPPRALPLRQNGILISDEASLARINQAYGAFKDVGTDKVLGFVGPQYVRPSLPLTEVKSDVVTGTEPGPTVLVKVQQVAPAIPQPAGSGDYEGTDYNATDFYVGDCDEPIPTPVVQGDWTALDFSRNDFLVNADQSIGSDPALGSAIPKMQSRAAASAKQSGVTTQASAAATSSTSTITTTGASPDTAVPVIKQARVFPVFKDAMGEQLRQRHPELFVPGLSDFPTGGVAVLDVNQAVIEAYMLGLNHALGAELLWRGFPVDLRGTFFQQFWDVSEHVNNLPDPATPLTAAEQAAQEAALLDIKPIDQWISNRLGANAPGTLTLGAEPLRMAIRSELLRRYPTLVIGLQPGTATGPDADPTKLVMPRQRLPVGQDLAVVTFDITLNQAIDDYYYLVVMERPGQPQFGLDEYVPTGTQPTDDPLSWNNLAWEYLGTAKGDNIQIDAAGKPHASTEPTVVAHLTDSAVVAYALFQEPVLAAIPIGQLLS